MGVKQVDVSLILSVEDGVTVDHVHAAFRDLLARAVRTPPSQRINWANADVSVAPYTDNPFMGSQHARGAP